MKIYQLWEFNPWLFSGSDQLVGQFFSELSTELQLRDLDKIGKAWEEYGDALTGGQSQVGSLGAIMKLIGRCLRRRQRGATGSRDRIRNILQRRTKPIVVVLDDVDRLSTSEIRAIFRLVRLTANFPNLIYIVVCDRLHVERALEEKGLLGRDYLKKIIQFPYDLPELPRQRFRGQILGTINDVLRSDQHSYPVGSKIASGVRDRIIQPLVVNMRDLRQYAASLHGTLVSVDGRVALDDLLALEATRLFMPDVFMRLPGALNTLTFRPTELEREVEVQEYIENRSEQVDAKAISRLVDRCKEAVDELIKLAGNSGEVAEGLVDELFPAASGIRHLSDEEVNKRVLEMFTNPNEHGEKQLKEGRVAHHEVLRFYLERVASGDLRAVPRGRAGI